MAVSGKTAAPHEIPYFLPGDKPPDMAAVTKASADQTHARLNAIAPKQIVGPAKKQLLIANAAGVVTAVLASGDVTNDESGKFTIAEKAVGEPKIADSAVTSRKLKPTLGFASASVGIGVLGTGYKDVPGTEKKFTVAVKSLVKVTAFFEFTMQDHNTPYGQGSFQGKIVLDGARGARRAFLGVDFIAGAEVATASVGVEEVLEVAAGEHALKLQAECTGGEIEVGNVSDAEYSYLIVAA